MRPSLRIHVINTYFFPVTAGIETAILQIFSLLRLRGHHITVHTSQNTLDAHNTLPPHDMVEGITVKRYHWTEHLGFFPSINPQDTEIVILENFDIFPHLRIFLWVLKLKILGKKRFSFWVVPHGSYTPAWEVFPISTRYIRIIYYHTIGLLLMNYLTEAILVVSDWEKDRMLRFGIHPKLLRILPNGIEAEAFTSRHPVSQEFKKKVDGLGKYIIQLARIDPVKNIESVLNALPFVSPEVKFVLAGPLSNPTYKQRLDKIIDQYQLKERVIFWGTLLGSEKFYLLAHAQLMIHMSFVETQPISVLEGMSQGLVCIVSLGGILPLLIRENKNGFTVKSTESQEIAHKIDYVISHSHSQEIEKIKATNKAAVRSRSWKKIADKMEKLILDYTTPGIIKV